MRFPHTCGKPLPDPETDRAQYSKMSKTNSRAGSRFKQPPKGYGILLQPLKSVFPTLNIRVLIVLTAELSEIRTPGTLTI